MFYNIHVGNVAYMKKDIIMAKQKKTKWTVTITYSVEADTKEAALAAQMPTTAKKKAEKLRGWIQKEIDIWKIHEKYGNYIPSATATEKKVL
jgi:hypothetical protein